MQQAATARKTRGRVSAGPIPTHWVITVDEQPKSAQAFGDWSSSPIAIFDDEQIAERYLYRMRSTMKAWIHEWSGQCPKNYRYKLSKVPMSVGTCRATGGRFL